MALTGAALGARYFFRRVDIRVAYTFGIAGLLSVFASMATYALVIATTADLVGTPGRRADHRPRLRLRSQSRQPRPRDPAHQPQHRHHPGVRAMTAQTVINLVLAIGTLGTFTAAAGSLYRLRAQKGIDKATETEIVARAAAVVSEKDLNEIAALRRDVQTLQEESRGG